MNELVFLCKIMFLSYVHSAIEIKISYKKKRCERVRKNANN